MPATSYPASFLVPFRAQGDPLADGVIAALVADGGLAAAGRTMAGLLRHDGVPDGDLPGPVRDYLDATSRLPPWADPERLRIGGEVFAEHGPLCVLALFHASLPTCYALGDGVQVLALTARLQTDATRRISETAQFVLDVMAPGGLEPGGAGIRDAQKVRLMHAAVRHLVRASGHWDPAWCEPLNQLDLALTLQTFSSVVLDALARLGVELEPEEEAGFVHTWRVVGHLLGVDERLSPDDPASARALMAAGGAMLFRACPEGQAMTRALQDLLQHVLPGNAFDGMAPSFTRFLAGDRVAELLGVAPADWTRRLFGPLRLLAFAGDELADHSALAGRIARMMTMPLLDAIAWMARGGERAPFAIPAALAAQWGVASPKTL